MPILSHVLLQAEDATLSLSATDMDLSVFETLPATVDTSGVATAPAYVVYDIVRKLPEGVIKIETQGHRINLKSGTSHFTLPTLPQEDFPLMRSEDLPYSITLSGNALRTILETTRSAMSLDDTRYYLNGVYLHTHSREEESYLRGIATDGHRLALRDVAVQEDISAFPGIIVPRKTVLELRKLLDGSDKIIQLFLSESQIKVCLGKTVLVSKLISGRFPDYKMVIPSSHLYDIVLECSMLAETVDRVISITTEKTRGVSLSFSPGLLKVSSRQEEGEAVEDINIDYDGPSLHLGFNGKYLLDILSQMQGKEVRCLLSDGESAVVFRDMGCDDSLFVLMPLRI